MKPGSGNAKPELPVKPIFGKLKPLNSVSCESKNIALLPEFTSYLLSIAILPFLVFSIPPPW